MVNIKINSSFYSMVFVEEYTIAIAEKLLSPSLDSLSSYEGKQTIMPIYSEMFCADDFLNVETCSTTLENARSLLATEGLLLI
jgi:hypothetical protein